jgi:hypothetical protein
VQVVIAPLALNVTVPDGAGRPLLPTTVALKVRSEPTVGLEGLAVKIIDGVAAPTLTFTTDDVAAR